MPEGMESMAFVTPDKRNNSSGELDMVAGFNALPQSARWNLLVEAAKRALRHAGYSLTRVPGRGLSNMYEVTRDGKNQRIAIRTSQDRYFAFNPLKSGGWQTLNDVEFVVIAVVDKRSDTSAVEVFMFPAADVRQRFNASLKARLDAGHVKRDFAMWLGLDADTSGSPGSAGSGIVDKYRPIAVYPVDELLAPAKVKASAPEPQTSANAQQLQEFRPATIAEVLRWARERVAEIAGVRLDAVRLELTLES